MIKWKSHDFSISSIPNSSFCSVVKIRNTTFLRDKFLDKSFSTSSRGFPLRFQIASVNSCISYFLAWLWHSPPSDKSSESRVYCRGAFINIFLILTNLCIKFGSLCWYIYICICSVWCPVEVTWRKVKQVNTLRPGQNGRRFPDDIFNCIFLNENVGLSLKISLEFIPNIRINNNPSLVQLMAWRRPGDKPISEPMMVCSPTHICVTRPQCQVNSKNTRPLLRTSVSHRPEWIRQLRLPYVARCLRMKIYKSFWKNTKHLFLHQAITNSPQPWGVV